MASVVWKIALKSTDVQDVDLPGGAEILSVAEQNETICMWFRCNPNIAKYPRRIAICGTGHGAPPEKEARFIGTLLLYGGTLVLHVFERIDAALSEPRIESAAGSAPGEGGE